GLLRRKRTPEYILLRTFGRPINKKMDTAFNAVTVASLAVDSRVDAGTADAQGGAAWPESAPVAGGLYVGLATATTAATLRDYLARSTIPFAEPHHLMLAIPLAAGRLQQLSQDLTALLSAAELQDARTLVVEPGVVPSISELRHTQSLSSLVGRVQGE